MAQAYESALPKLTVHHMENRGVSLGRNAGASLAQYNRILFLDADVSLPRNFLAKALYELEENKLEVAGVYMSSKGLPLVHKFGYGLLNAGLFTTQFFFPTAIGACIFSTKRVHDEIGGFDEEIVLCEDCDYVRGLCHRSKFGCGQWWRATSTQNGYWRAWFISVVSDTEGNMIGLHSMS